LLLQGHSRSRQSQANYNDDFPSQSHIKIERFPWPKLARFHELQKSS